MFDTYEYIDFSSAINSTCECRLQYLYHNLLNARRISPYKPGSTVTPSRNMQMMLNCITKYNRPIDEIIPINKDKLLMAKYADGVRSRLGNY